MDVAASFRHCPQKSTLVPCAHSVGGLVGGHATVHEKAMKRGICGAAGEARRQAAMRLENVVPGAGITDRTAGRMDA
jgi:hypothetical protein